jgi:hypothetical protein
VTINYTGSTIGLNVDGGASTGTVQNVSIENLIINSTASATTAFFVRAITHSVFKNIRMRNFLTNGLLAEFMVNNVFEDIYCTGNEPGITVQTGTGLYLSNRGAGEQSSACTFTNVCMEGVSGVGILLDSASRCTFVGGTSEGNNIGLYSTYSSNGNTIIDLDMEENTTADIEDQGIRNTFIGCLSNNLSTFSETAATIIGGEYVQLTIASGAKGTNLIGVGINTLTDSSTTTTKTGCYSIIGGAVIPANFPTGLSLAGGSVLDNYSGVTSYTSTATGLTVSGTAPTITAKYSRIGDLVTVWIEVVSPGGSTNASVAGTTTFSLPFSAANTQTCSATNASTAVGLGNGTVVNGVAYSPVWSAGTDFVVTSTYLAVHI